MMWLCAGYVFEDRGLLAIKGKGTKRCYILKYREVSSTAFAANVQESMLYATDEAAGSRRQRYVTACTVSVQ
jgi:hypothetical protein